MKSTQKWFSLAVFCFITSIAVAQVPENVTVNSNDDFPDFTKPAGSSSSKPAPASKPSTTTTQPTSTPSSSSSSSSSDAPVKIEKAEDKSEIPADADAPLDGIVELKTIMDKQLLPWEPVRESDVMWKKRIWRVIDVREKMNLAFVHPEGNFFSLLMKGIQDQDSSKALRAYRSESDKFLYKITPQEVSTMGSSIDTITQVDPITYETKYKVIVNKLNPEDIRRFRVKEEWFFDRQYSTLKVRILGIAPIIEKKDDNGNYLGEQVLFWVRYPDCREYLSRQKVFMEGNDANPMSWEDLFELRRFSSYVFKESNVHNRRLQEYLQGIDILLEGEKIKSEIFNFEHDLWSY
jgi:gliding motility associated protien GldN